MAQRSEKLGGRLSSIDSVCQLIGMGPNLGSVLNLVDVSGGWLQFGAGGGSLLAVTSLSGIWLGLETSSNKDTPNSVNHSCG